MQVISFVTQKGGSGKTTLAFCCAVAAHQQGKEVLIVDMDPQGTAEKWYQDREDERPRLVHLESNKLDSALTKAEDNNFDIEINKPKHSYVDNKDQSDCIRKGFEEFKEQHPQRADALELFAQGYMHAEIAPIINKTPGATKEFISQCRKIVDSFIGHCKEIK